MTNKTLTRSLSAPLARRLTGIDLAIAFSPANLQNLALWLSADSGVYSDAGSTLASNNAPIQQWNDRSSHGRNAAQATLEKRPLLIADGLNGNPVLRFDGVAHLMTVVFGATLAQPNTIWLLVKDTTGSGFRRYVDGIASTNRHLIGSNNDFTVGNWQVFAGSSLIGSVTDGDFHLFAATFNGASSSLDIGEKTNATGDAGSHSLTGLTIGAAYDGSVNTSLDVAEIIVIEGEATAEQKGNVDAYVNAKYGAIAVVDHVVESLTAELA